MSSFMLRILALVTMLADHTGLALFPGVSAFRCAGRLSFPIYCFLLAQGCRHTRDIRAYGRRLLLAAILSEIPFDLLIFGRIASPMEQNVLFALLLGLMAIYAAELFKARPMHALLSAACLCLCAMLANVSYGWLGVVLCLGAHQAGGNKRRLALSMGSALLLYSLSLLLSGVARSWVMISFCALFSLVPILGYNGRRGMRSPLLTFLFYAAYPLHIVALVIVRALRIVPPYFFQ